VTIINLQRDGVFYESGSNEVTWATQYVESSETALVTIPPVVNYDYGVVYSNRFQTSWTTTQLRAIGLAMQHPQGDRTPYRVKAGILVSGDEGFRAQIMVGYGPASLASGIDLQVDEPRYFPLVSDDEIIVENQLPGDTYYGRPVIFSVVIAPPKTNANAVVFAHLSVQNLGVKPPTMQNAIS
jgi:hypothetical protein